MLSCHLLNWQRILAIMTLVVVPLACTGMSLAAGPAAGIRHETARGDAPERTAAHAILRPGRINAGIEATLGPQTTLPRLPAQPATATAAAGVTGAAAGTPEIESLARSLRYDARLIYEYVRNNIDFVPSCGTAKGATMTLIDGTGNDVDQASLMIALLRASGYTAQYVYGGSLIPLEQAGAWLGVPPDPDLIHQILISTAGFEGSLVPSADPTHLQLWHIWVRVDVDGAWYEFFPAFKLYAVVDGIDLAAAMGYDAAAFMADALLGATVDPNYVQDVNATNIYDDLTTYADALVGHLRSNMPEASLADVIGGRAIIPVTGEPFQTELPFTDQYEDYYFNDLAEDFWEHNAIELQYRGIQAYLYIHDVYGKRLTLTENDLDQVELRLEGELIATGDPAPYGERNPIDVRVNYASWHSEGTFLDSYYTAYLEAGGSYVIMNGWGPCGRGRIERHRRKLQEALEAGLGTDSEVVVGETLSMAAAMYLAEDSAAQQLADGVNHTITTNYYTVGFCGLESGVFFDIPLAATSVIDLDAPGLFPADAFFTQAGIGSAFEWGVIEQSQGAEAVSTINLLDLANGESQRIFDATADNWYTTVRSQLVDYDDFLDLFDAYIDGGYRLVIPEEGHMSVGYWSGAGLLAIGPEDRSIAHLIVGGLWFGGSAIYPGDIMPLHTLQTMIPTQHENQHTQSDEPVDLVTGAYLHRQTDLTVGNGPAPFSLAFERYYSSAARRDLSDVGRGWRHNFDIRIHPSSDGLQGLGEDSPVDAAAAVAALFVARDVLAGGTSAEQLLVASLCERWFMDRLLWNVATVSGPGSDWPFVRLADGTYNPPPGQAAELADLGLDGFLLTDRHGESFRFGLSGELQTWKDRNDNAIHLQWYVDAVPLWVESISNSTGRSLTLQHNEGRLSSVTDSSGRTASYMYDGQNNLTTVTSVTGFDTAYAYDELGRLTRVYNPAHPADPFITNSYDAADRVMTQTNAAGNSWSYYCTGASSEEVDPLGQSELICYDRRGRAVRQVDRAGQEWSCEYDAHDRLVRIVFPEGNRVEYAYDVNHNPVAMTAHPKPGSPLAPMTWTYAYEQPWNLLRSVTDTLGRTITYTYDANGNLQRTDWPEIDGMVPQTTFARNARGQATTIVDAEGRTRGYTYDPITGDLLAIVCDPGGLNLATQFAYDAAGNVVARTDPRGHTTSFSYDPARRLAQSTAPVPFSTAVRFRYDADGNLIAIQRQTDDPEDPWQTTTVTRTPTGKRATVIDPEGKVHTYAYDARDLLWRETDAEMHTTEYEYDELGRLYRVVDPLGHVTEEHAYSPNGVRRNLTDANGNVVAYEMDGLDRIIGIAYPDGTSRWHVYDDAGRMTDRYTRAGDRICFAYDPLDRVVAKTVAGAPPITYAYELTGALVAVTDADGQSTFDYDSAGRLTGTTLPGGDSLMQRLDAAGNVTALIYPDGFNVYYTYDALDRLERIDSTNPQADFDADGDADLMDFAKMQRCMGGPGVPPATGCEATDVDGDGDVDLSDHAVFAADATGPGVPAHRYATYTYDAQSRRVLATHGNSTSVAYTYDDAGRLLSIVNRLIGIERSCVYALDGVGRRTSMMVDGLDLHGYDYDAADRLTAVDFPEGYPIPDTAYTFDAAGNRQTVIGDGPIDYIANNLNQYTSVGGVPFAYDLNGNLVSDGGRTFTYDAENQLVEALTPEHATVYGYDPFGRRRTRTVDGTTTFYHWAGQEVLAESDDQGAVIRHFIYAPGADEPVCMIQSGTEYYYHQDGLGSVVALSDRDGREVESYRRGLYGEEEPSSVIGNPRRFTGQQWDAESLLYDFRSRTYDPRIGRFLQEDPAGHLGGMNLYDYVGADPVNRVDPFGLATGAIGIGGQVVLGAISAKLTVGVILDDSGKVAMFIAPGGGGGAGWGGGLALQATWTNADDIYGASGTSIDAGASVGPVTVEANISPSGVTGTTVGIGLKSTGLPAEAHVQGAYTFVGPSVNLKQAAQQHPYWPASPMPLTTKVSTAGGQNILVQTGGSFADPLPTLPGATGSTPIIKILPSSTPLPPVTPPWSSP